MQRTRENCVLRSRAELEEAAGEAVRRGFPLCDDMCKNWDTLLATEAVTRRVPKRGNVLDAGAEVYSMLLPWLRRCGYQNLLGINLSFEASFERNGIRYEPGDLTRTVFPTASFDAVVCQSVIEHGIHLGRYFREMSRIIRPGGVLITSTDYFPEVIDTREQRAFGSAIHIFSRTEVVSAIALAVSNGFALTSDIDLSAHERVVTWEEYSLSYTFVLLTLKRAGGEGHRCQNTDRMVP